MDINRNINENFDEMRNIIMDGRKLVDIAAMKQMSERISQEIKSSGGGGQTQSDDVPVMNCEYDAGKYKLSLNGGSDMLNIKFTTDHPYIVGEYLEIEGVRYDIKPNGGGNLTNGLWKANTIVSGTLDTTDKSFYVDLANRGGGTKLEMQFIQAT